MLKTALMFFTAPASYKVAEPGTLILTVRRDGQAKNVARVRFRTRDGTAVAGERDYLPLSNGLIIFAVGEKEKMINVTIPDDSIPETDETFYVELYDPKGNAPITDRKKQQK